MDNVVVCYSIWNKEAYCTNSIVRGKEICVQVLSNLQHLMGCSDIPECVLFWCHGHQGILLERGLLQCSLRRLKLLLLHIYPLKKKNLKKNKQTNTFACFRIKKTFWDLCHIVGWQRTALLIAWVQFSGGFL